MTPSTFRKVALITVTALLVASLSGCMYTRERTDDFLDIWDLGIGVTAESQENWFPPSLGALVEAGPIAVGAITFDGLIAEIDGRGLYAGPDERARLALIYIQGWEHWQDYEEGHPGFYKDIVRSRAWHERMEDNSYVKKLFRWRHPGSNHIEVPAKDLLHEDTVWTWEVFPFRRGWQYWETIAVEAGISEPLLTHAGLYLRVGIDPSEIADFLLGIFTLDPKGDDFSERPARPEPEPQVVEVEVEVPVEVPVEVVRTLHTRDFEFGDVLFNLDDDTLTDAGAVRVDEIEEALEGSNVNSMRITGHCCDRGSEEYNYELGLRRANTVADALAARGFARDAMAIESMGETMPRVANVDEASRSLNRRVEVRVTFTTEE